MAEKTCPYCGTIFITTGRNHKFCTKICQYKWQVDNGIQKEYRDRANAKMGMVVGIGSGGLTGKGEKNQNYKHGRYTFRNYARELVRLGVPCNKCGKDLTGATRGYWCGHHKDHDPTNNNLNNLEILCKRCHQIHHESHHSFTKVQRLSREGVELAQLEAQSFHTVEDDIV